MKEGTESNARDKPEFSSNNCGVERQIAEITLTHGGRRERTFEYSIHPYIHLARKKKELALSNERTPTSLNRRVSAPYYSDP